MYNRKDINDFKPLLANYLTEYHNINIDKFFMCLNPEHDDEHPSMRYTDKYHICKCFSCGASYDIFDVIGVDYNVSLFKDQLDIVNKLYPDIMEKQEIFKTPENVNSKVDFSKYYKECMKNISKTNYLESRKIASDLINKYKIGYDISRDMIIFPINRNCYFGRGVNKNIKIKSKGTSYLWNEKLLADSNNKLIYVTESIIDSLSLETIDPGIKTVALNGLPNYKRLLSVIKNNNYGGHLILAFDNDKIGKIYQDIVKEELTKLNVGSFSNTLISNIDSKICKDLNEALINKRDTLEKNYKYFDENFKKIIEITSEKESELVI